MLGRPGKHGVRGELRLVIRDDHAWLAAPGDEGRQFPREAASRDRCKALAGHVVDDIEDPKAPPAGQLIVNEVDRPAGIRLCLDQDWRPRADRSSPGASLPHRQPLLVVKAIDPVDARWLAISAKQDKEATVFKPAPFVRQSPQTLS